MTMTKMKEVEAYVEEKLGNDYDVDKLSATLEEINLDTEEAFTCCMVLLGLSCLQAFEYKGQKFFNSDQINIINNANELKYL